MLVILICLLGIGIRLWNIDGQIIADDEVHAAVAAARHDFAYLATHHETSDYSIPMALWDRLLIQGPGLDEQGLRAPVIAAGILFLVFFSAFVWKEVGALEAILATGLVAASPLLVLYSRFARPYMPMVLLSFLCFVGRHFWSKSGRWRWAMLSACAGASAILLNVLSAPTVACIWGLELVRRRPGSLRFIGMAAAATLLLMGPSVRSLLEMAREKAGVERPPLVIWWRAAELFAGTRVPVAAVWLFVSGLLGAARLWTRMRDEVLLFSLMFVLQVATVAVLAPVGTREVLVLARYLMAPMFGAAILVAAGLAAQVEAAARRTTPALSIAFAALLLGAVIKAGFLPIIYWRPNAFTSHAQYYEPEIWRRVDMAYASVFYDFVAAEEDQTQVVEAPATIAWWGCPYQEYQHLHRHRVTTAMPVPELLAKIVTRGGLRVATVRFVFEHRKFALAPNEFLIVHRDLFNEGATHWQHERFDPDWNQRRRDYLAEAEFMIGQLDGAYPVAFSDEQVKVYAGSEEGAARAARWFSTHPRTR